MALSVAVKYLVTYSWLTSLVELTWCFKLSQPDSLISEPRETFIKRYIQLKGPIEQK